MPWKIGYAARVKQDLEWFDKNIQQWLVDELETLLAQNPLAKTRHMKDLRPNPVAERELRLRGKYRVFFNVNVGEEQVWIVLIGEKARSTLLVRGKEFRKHETNPPQQGKGKSR